MDEFTFIREKLFPFFAENNIDPYESVSLMAIGAVDLMIRMGHDQDTITSMLEVVKTTAIELKKLYDKSIQSETT